MARRSRDGLMVVGAVIVVVALMYIFNTYTFPDLPLTIGADFVGIIGGLVITVFGIFTSAEAKGSPGVIGCFAVTGVGFAILLYQMNAMGIVTDAMLLPATVAQYQVILIVAATILGSIVYAEGR